MQNRCIVCIYVLIFCWEECCPIVGKKVRGGGQFCTDDNPPSPLVIFHECSLHNKNISYLYDWRTNENGSHIGWKYKLTLISTSILSRPPLMGEPFHEFCFGGGEESIILSGEGPDLVKNHNCVRLKKTFTVVLVK